MEFFGDLSPSAGRSDLIVVNQVLIYNDVHAATRYDVLFTLATSNYGPDAPRIELRLVDVRPA